MNARRHLGHLVRRYTRDDMVELARMYCPGWSLAELLRDYPGWCERGMREGDG